MNTETMSDEEINRRLAEWLEPMSTLPPLPDELVCDVDTMLANVWRAVSYYHEGDVVRWEAPNFLHDEVASALLRAKLLSLGCSLVANQEGIAIHQTTRNELLLAGGPNWLQVTRDAALRCAMAKEGE